MLRPHFVMPVLLALALPACSGGGGSSPAASNPVPPAPQPTQASKPTLGAGFQSGLAPTSAKVRVVQSATLSGELQPLVGFLAPDAYVTQPIADVTGVQAVAYLKSANASDLAITPPPVSWSYNGASNVTATNVASAITTAQLDPAGGYRLPLSPVQNVTPLSPRTVGQALVTASAVGQSVVIKINTYSALGVGTLAGASAQSLSFVNGVAQPSTTNVDLQILYDGNGVASLDFPFGAVLVPNIDMIRVTSVAPSSIPSGDARISALAFVTSVTTIEFRTHDGLIGRFSPNAGSAYTGGDASKGQINVAYGAYRIGDVNGNFDY